MPAEPKRVEATGMPAAPASPVPRPGVGSPGRNGARCAATATGPTPGPPPPCGMQNVLCRFRCETSPPNSPGRARPTSAFRFAPSMYTWPPASCTRSQTSRTSLLVHAVRGRVGDHDRRDLGAVLVELGAQVVELDRRRRPPSPPPRPACPRAPPRPRWCRGPTPGSGRCRAPVLAARRVVAADREQAGELALGAGVGLEGDRGVAGDLGELRLQRGDELRVALRSGRRGANGWMEAKPGQEMASISAVALSFMVQEPSGIIVRSSARSWSESLRR